MNEVDAYLSNVEPKQKAELERVRRIIRETVPDAVELISYGVPAFKYNDQPLAYYSVSKDHMSFFPTSGPVSMLGDKLTGYKTSKGTIQFTLEKPLTEELIKEILAVRIGQLDA